MQEMEEESEEIPDKKRKKINNRNLLIYDLWKK